jgi:hypothetical protein
MRGVHNRLVNGGMKYVEQGTALKYLAKDGTTEIARIDNGTCSVTPTKGSIPAQNTYLDAEYLTARANKFKTEGAAFIAIKSWTEGGAPQFTTLPPRKFVGLRSEMDKVISDYKAAGNDWTILRDRLSYPPSTDFSAEEIYYIKIDGSDSRFTFEVPNGNESGAIVGEWVPGGFTKAGTSEAALVGSEKVVHNKSINTLVNNFSGNWEKIK